MASKNMGFGIRLCVILSLIAPAASAEPEAAYVATPGAGMVIVQVPTHLAGNDIDAVWQREIRTHAVLMRQRSLFEKIISNENSEVRKTAVFVSLKGGLRMIEWMEKNVRVQAVPGTALIEVSVPPMENALDARTIIKEVVVVYLENVAQKHFLNGQIQSQQLNALRSKYRALYRETTETLSKLLSQTPSAEEKPGWAERLKNAQREQSDVLERLKKIEGDLDALEVLQSQKISGEVTWASFPNPTPIETPKAP